MNIGKIGARAALIAALLASGVALSGCHHGRPGYDSDYHHRHHRGDNGPYR